MIFLVFTRILFFPEKKKNFQNFHCWDFVNMQKLGGTGMAERYFPGFGNHILQWYREYNTIFSFCPNYDEVCKRLSLKFLFFKCVSVTCPIQALFLAELIGTNKSSNQVPVKCVSVTCLKQALFLAFTWHKWLELTRVDESLWVSPVVRRLLQALWGCRLWLAVSLGEKKLIKYQLQSQIINWISVLHSKAHLSWL